MTASSRTQDTINTPSPVTAPRVSGTLSADRIRALAANPIDPHPPMTAGQATRIVQIMAGVLP